MTMELTEQTVIQARPGTIGEAVRDKLNELRRYDPNVTIDDALARLCIERPDIDDALANKGRGFDDQTPLHENVELGANTYRDNIDALVERELFELRKSNPNAEADDAFASLCRKHPDLDEKLNGFRV